MIHILNHKKLMFIIVYFFSYWIKIWPGLKQKKDCMVLFQIEDGYNFKGESESYTGIKICFFWHSQLDGSLKAFRADWIQGRPNIYKHTNILIFFFLMEMFSNWFCRLNKCPSAGYALCDPVWTLHNDLGALLPLLNEINCNFQELPLLCLSLPLSLPLFPSLPFVLIQTNNVGPSEHSLGFVELLL